MLKKSWKTIVVLAFILSLLPVSFTLAVESGPSGVPQEPGPYLGLEYGAATGLGNQDIRMTVARIINASLGLLGIISVVIIVYAGFKWMTAGGNEESAKEAQKILMASVIGLAIILSAYAISKFVTTQLFQATTGLDYSNTIEDNS